MTHARWCPCGARLYPLTVKRHRQRCHYRELLETPPVHQTQVEARIEDALWILSTGGTYEEAAARTGFSSAEHLQTTLRRHRQKGKTECSA